MPELLAQEPISTPLPLGEVVGDVAESDAEIMVREGKRLAAGPRLLGHVRGEKPGPTLVFTGSVHGNEPAGALGLERLLQSLTSEGLSGNVFAFVGNRRALAAGKRYLETDLNRTWTRRDVMRVREADPSTLQNEDREMYELDIELKKIINDFPKPVYAVDLHTTSGPGPAFANLDDTLPNRRFSLEFPAPIVMGLEEELAGTLTSYLSYNGATTLGFESGQHLEMVAVERAEAAAWIALEAAGLLPRGERAEVSAARDRLKTDMGDLPQVVEVTYRHGVAPYDKFRMEPGWTSFQKMKEGQILGRDRSGPVLAPRDGRILMPLYQKQGADGFFVIRRVHPVWLKISEYVRRGHAERFLEYLPGVQVWEEQPGRYLVDLRVARWYALEMFHLLGFRRQQQTQNQLVMSRRTRL